MNELKLDLNTTQLKKLHKGSGIIIKPAQIGSGHSIMIGKVKLNKLMKGKEKGKGTKLQLSAEEIKKNSKEGDGVFSQLAVKGLKALGKMAVKKLKEKGKEKAKEVGKKVAKKAVEKLAKKVGEQNETLGKIVSDVGNQAVDKGVEIADKKIEEKMGKGRVRKPRTIKKEVITFENEGEGMKDMIKDVVKKQGKKLAKSVAKSAVRKVASKTKIPLVSNLIQEHGDMLVDKVAGDGLKAGGSFKPFGKFLRKAGKKIGKYALPVAAGAAGNFIGGPAGAAVLSGITGDLTKGWGVQDTTQIQFGKGMDEKGNPLVAGNYSNFLPPDSSVYIPKGSLNVNQTISGYAQHGSGIYSSRGNGLYSGNGLYTSRRYGNGAPIPQGTYDSYAI